MYDIFRIFTKDGRWRQVLGRGGTGIAKVIIARPDGQHGPVFWESLASEGFLAPVLMARIMQGGGPGQVFESTLGRSDADGGGGDEQEEVGGGGGGC